MPETARFVDPFSIVEGENECYFSSQPKPEDQASTGLPEQSGAQVQQVPAVDDIASG